MQVSEEAELRKEESVPRTIPLTQGKVTIVDDRDFEWLNQWKWCATRTRNLWYAVRAGYSHQRRHTIYMHRLILNSPPNLESDHRNGDSLDNRRINLRVCTKARNQMNSHKRTGCSSKYKGVSWHSRNQKWRADIQINGKKCYLGTFANELEAAVIYNSAARKHFGEFARLNIVE